MDTAFRDSTPTPNTTECGDCLAAIASQAAIDSQAAKAHKADNAAAALIAEEADRPSPKTSKTTKASQKSGGRRKGKRLGEEEQPYMRIHCPVVSHMSVACRCTASASIGMT